MPAVEDEVFRVVAGEGVADVFARYAPGCELAWIGQEHGLFEIGVVVVFFLDDFVLSTHYVIAVHIVGAQGLFGFLNLAEHLAFDAVDVAPRGS